MGNKVALATVATPVESYLHEVPGLVLRNTMGHGRFLKTLQCFYDNGGLVSVKAYVKASALSPSSFNTSQQAYQGIVKQETEEIAVTRERLIALRDACLGWTMPAQLLPFQQVLETDSSAVLIRQYASYSLRERLSTLPFLGHLDRVWIVYQMLQAGAQMETLGICHGDIKVDNFVLTTANWVFLTDFVACKPIALPEDNPVDFSIFFNTSGSRTTCIAPERFIKEGAADAPTELTHKMDIFALGCTIAEFWLEGQPVFDLAQLLDYRREGGTSCPGPVKKINEPALQRLVEGMVKLDPNARLTAQEYLNQWTPELFPEWFYDLWLFCGQLVAQPADKRVEIINENFKALVELLKDPHSDSSEKFSRTLRSGYGLTGNSESTDGTEDGPHADEGSGKDTVPDKSTSTSTTPDTATGTQGSLANEPLGDLGITALVTETEAFVKYNIKPLEAELAKQQGETEHGDEIEEETEEGKTDETERHEGASGNKQLVDSEECETEDDAPQKKQQLNGLSLIVPFLTSSLRSCTTASSKITALELFVLFAQNVSEECIMQRIVPYAVSMLSDTIPTVRASAIKCLDALFYAVKKVPPSEIKVFPEYIIPILQQLSTGEKEEIVLLSLMSSLASFATSAQRFLEYAQLMKQQACADDANNQTADTLMLMTQESYDREMGSLARSFSDIIQELLTRHTINSIKFVFISIVEPLAHFFGQRRTNEIILPLFISFLNDPDWRLREAVFKHMVGLASFAGRHTLEAFILPCIQQALLDREENVIYQTVTALTRLCRLGLFNRRTLIDLAERCAPMLLHPSAWIRYGAIGVMEALSSKLDLADVYCFVLPQLKPFLRQEIMSVTRNVLLQSLHPHVMRTSFEKAKSLLIGNNSDASKDRNTQAGSSEEGTRSERPQPLPNTFFAGLLASTNLPSQEQYRLLLMEPYISAYCRQRVTDSPLASESSSSSGLGTGRVMGGDSSRRTGSKSSEGDSYFHRDFPLHKIGENEPGSKSGAGPKIVMHTGWQDAITESKKLEGTTSRTKGTGRDAEVPGLDLGPVPPNVPWRQSSDANNANSSSVRLRGFRPKGVHIGHLSEHDGPVTVLRVSDDDLFFASGSDDGKVKIWDCARLERNVTNRARRTFCGAYGRVAGLAVCEGTHSVACGYDTGSVHVFRVDYCANTAQPYRSLSLLRQCEGFGDGLVGLENCGRGRPALLAYGLASNVVGGLDLRCRDAGAFCFAGEARHGLLEAFVVSPDRLWLLTGTSRGYFVVWDLRFGLPVMTWRQPAKRRVRRLAHKEGDLVAAAADGDDVMLWDVSTASVTQLFSVRPAGAEGHAFSFGQHPNPNPPLDYGADELQELQDRSDAILAGTVSADTAASAATASTTAAMPHGGDASRRSGPAAGTPMCTTALYCTKDTVLTGGSDCCVRLWETAFATNPPAPNSYTVCRPRSTGVPPEQYSATVVECSVVQQATVPVQSGGLGPGLAGASPSSLYPSSPAGAGTGEFGAGSSGMAAASVAQGQNRTVLPDTPEYHHDAILDIVAIEHPTPKILTAGRDGVIKVWK